MEPFPSRDAVAAGAPRETGQGAAPRFRRVRHTVKRGETVAAVAERYAVTPSQLRRWNGLGKSSALAPRRQLVVFVPLPAAPASPGAGVQLAAAKPRAAASPRSLAASADSAAKPEALGTAAAQIVSSSRTSPRSLAPTASRVAKTAPAPAATTVQADDSVPATYVVQRGDFLEKVARTHGLTVAQLMARNQLTTITLTPGQKLQLRETTEAVEELTTATREVAAQAQAPLRSATATRPTSAAPKRPVLPAPQVHLVQPGDTLYNISRRYQGLTVEKLRELNNLQSDEVKPGQKLIVRS